MRILLISPSDSGDLNLQAIREIPYLLSDAFFAPHACAVVAALTPPGHEVVIHDEHLHGPADARFEREPFDVVGISALTNQFARTRALAERFRERSGRGVLVVGGMGTGAMLHRLRELADAVFVGEAEDTWPRFLEDLARGTPQRVYREVAKSDMARVPVPRWELIAGDLPRYNVVPIQTSRGCPWDCNFCDVIYTFGRRLRFKPVEQVLEEVRRAARLRAKMVYFADDNFAADRAFAKRLLGRLAELNRALPVQLSFIAQVDLTVADDPELLQLFLDANVVDLQIGVESTDEAVLREMNKLQNARRDPVGAVREIQSYGITVLAHMIVGSDGDDFGVFERVRRFLRQAGLVHHACHPLQAPPGTRVWYDLRRQGRVVDAGDELRDGLDFATNILPKRMTRVELMEGLADHWLRAVDPDDYRARLGDYLRGIRHRPRVAAANAPSPWALRSMLARLLRYYLLQVPSEQRRLFLRVLDDTRRIDPALMPKAFFAHSLYTLEWRRALAAAERVRRQAAWERARPPLPVLSAPLPVPPPFREAAREAIPAAYRRVRTRLADRRELYRAVLEALVDFVDRFGDGFERLDPFHADALEKSCDRVLDGLGAPRTAAEVPEPLPAEPPGGFVRELLDALDETRRVRARG